MLFRSTVAYVCDRSLYTTATTPGATPVLLAQAQSPTQSWGLADFVAAEELERVRGLWWLADSAAVLAEFADEEPVEVRWISDPARPEREPVPHRYPAAGTANPIARLFRIALDGTRTEITWDAEQFPYLATVIPDGPDHAGAVVSVLSRDQRRQRILLLDAAAAIEAVHDRSTSPWITLQPGVPCRTADGALLEIVADTDADTFQLRRDDVALTPAGLQVTALVDSERMIVTAQPGPARRTGSGRSGVRQHARQHRARRAYHDQLRVVCAVAAPCRAVSRGVRGVDHRYHHRRVDRAGAAGDFEAAVRRCVRRARRAGSRSGPAAMPAMTGERPGAGP